MNRDKLYETITNLNLSYVRKLKFNDENIDFLIENAMKIIGYTSELNAKLGRAQLEIKYLKKSLKGDK